MEIFAELIVSGFIISHEEFTRLLGIKPTTAYNKGDEKKTTNKIAKFYADKNIWRLKSSLSEMSSLNEHLKYFTDKVINNKIIFLEITKEADARIDIIINPQPHYQDYFEIDPLISGDIFKLNLKLTFSIYNQ